MDMLLNFRMVKPEDMRADIHPLAVVDTEEPIMECVGCELPVPMEVKNIYCSAECEDKAFEVALIDNAIAEAKAEDDIFGQMFPQVAMLAEPRDPFIECSCKH